MDNVHFSTDTFRCAETKQTKINQLNSGIPHIFFVEIVSVHKLVSATAHFESFE